MTALTMGDSCRTKAAAKARVFIVDDHPMVRRGLQFLINHEPGLCVCGEAEEADDAFARILKLQPSVAIVDLTLTGASGGLELIRRLREAHLDLKILVFSLHQERFYQKQAADVGADAFVGKDQGPAKVVSALRELLHS